MGQSFIRQGTCVVCTNMTCGKPQKIGVTRGERYVMNTSSEEPLLNMDDRKISASFGCRSPQSFFAGLCALCVGICIGVAIAAAVIATGGAAAVVVAAAVCAAKAAVVFTAGVIVGSCIAYAVNHDCDETLACQWERVHLQVNLEGRPALLNSSQMRCTRKGVIDIILDEPTAIKAAEYISACNDKAFWQHVGSQGIQGVFSGLTAGVTGPVGIVEMSIETGIYCISEYDDALGQQATAANIAYGAKDDLLGGMTATDAARDTKAAADAADTAVRSSEVAMDGYKDAVKTAGKTAGLPGRGQAAARRTQSQAQRALNMEKARHANLERQAGQAGKTHQAASMARNAAWKKFLGGLGLNIVAAILNDKINSYSNDMEKKNIKAATTHAKITNESDESNTQANDAFIGIVANEK